MVETWSVLDKRIQNLFAVYGRNLAYGREIEHRSHREVEAASTIKLLIMVYLLKQAQQNVLPWNGRWEVKQADLKKGGSGMLQCMMPQGPVEISQLCLLMMGASDNAAANALLRLLGGTQKVNEFAQSIGLTDTKLLMSPIDTSKRRKEKFRIGVTTAANMGDLLVRLLRGDLLDPIHTQYALDVLGAAQQSYITRGINTGQLKAWGSKTGTLYQRLDMVVLNECGFVVSRKDDKIVMCVFSQQPNAGPLPFSQDAPARQQVVRVMTDLYEALL